jgi:hypothetical protein
VDDVTLGHVEVEVYVLPVRDVTIVAEPLRGQAYPGGHVEVSLELRNRGNGPDLVVLSATGPGLEGARFILEGANTTTVWLPAGGERAVTFWALVAADAPLGEQVLEVTAVSADDPTSKAQVKAPYTVVWPELDVASVDLDPASPRANEVVTVKVHLFNGGPCEVVDVVVTMAGAEAERLASIAPGGEATVVFTWATGEPGRATLRGEVAFGPGDHRQLWSHAFEVAGEATDGPAFSRWWAPAVAVAVAVALVLLALAHWRQARPWGAAAVDEAPPVHP